MSGTKLRVGIIGIGWFALKFHAPRLRETGKAEIVALSRRNPRALADAQEALGVESGYTDWRELIDALVSEGALDAVVVSTAHHAHRAPTVAALERGLHVLVEKPMALTVQDAQAMVQAAERSGRVLMVGYNARCRGAWRAAAQALQEGALGTVRQVNLALSYNLRWLLEAERAPDGMIESMGIPPSFVNHGDLRAYWRRDPGQMGGGQFSDTGSHWVDVALWLGGAPPVEVVALSESDGLSVECFLSLQARLANGVLLSISSADGIPATENRLTIYGDQGVLTAEWAGWSTPSIAVHRAEGSEPLAVDLPDITTTAAFVETVLEGAPNLAPARAGAEAVALTEAAYRSIAERRIVRVDGR